MTTQPLKTDSTTPCKCGGTMRIKMVEPLPDEPDMMQHTFACTCGETASFRFPKTAAPRLRRMNRTGSDLPS